MKRGFVPMKANCGGLAKTATWHLTKRQRNCQGGEAIGILAKTAGERPTRTCAHGGEKIEGLGLEDFHSSGILYTICCCF